MWIKTIAFSLITVVIAGNVQHREEDARKDILTIINYAFGHKTIGHLGERNGSLQLNERNRVIRAIKYGSDNRRIDTHLAIEQPMELNLNQRRKLLSNVNANENQTENISQKVSDKEVTIEPQIKNITTKVIDEDRWIWDDGTTTTTLASVLDFRAAFFTGDGCPTGLVKFDNKCEDEF